jgi:hypothetical protein
MGAISCQQKYLTLIFFCLFADWGEHHGKQGWFQAGEDMCGCSRKVVCFKIVCKTDFKLQQEYLLRNTHSLLYHELPKLQNVFASKHCCKEV